MKYKIIENRYITMQDVSWSASDRQTEHFIRHWHFKGYTFLQSILVNEAMLEYAHDKKCFLDWLIKKGHIKEIKQFQPFTIEIPVNSREEYLEVWYKMGLPITVFDGSTPAITERIDMDGGNSHKLWKYVDVIGRRHGIH